MWEVVRLAHPSVLDEEIKHLMRFFQKPVYASPLRRLLAHDLDCLGATEDGKGIQSEKEVDIESRMRMVVRRHAGHEVETLKPCGNSG